MNKDTSEQVYLGQQPILDRNQQLVAYELLFRSGTANYARVVDDFEASARVIMNVLSQFGLEQVLGDRRGFINVNGAMLMSDAIELLPPHQIVLELLETIEPTPEIVQRCYVLRERGFTLALDDFVFEERFTPLIDAVDIIKFDLTLSTEADLATVTQHLGHDRLTFLAEKVETQEQFHAYLDMGFDLFQGYYFARPTLRSGRQVAPRQMLLLRLVSQLMSGADFDEIEDSLKQDPNLTLSLLRLANSAAFRVGRPVQSLRQALVVLGQQQMLRWMHLLMYTHQKPEDPHIGPLMTLAATRGRFLELLAEDTPTLRTQRDLAFVVGVLSLLDALLGVPLAEGLQGVHLEEPVLAALQEREGILGYALRLTEAIELDQCEQGQEAAGVLGTTLEAVAPLHIEACAWARALETA